MLLRKFCFWGSGAILMVAAVACGDDDDDDTSADGGPNGNAGNDGNGGSGNRGGRDGEGGDAGADGGEGGAGSDMDASTPDDLDAGILPDGGGSLDSGVDASGETFDPCLGGIPLPSASTYVAPGLCARAVATEQGRLRQITFAPNGDLFGVTVAGQIKRYRDANGDGAFDDGAPETVAWADTGGNGNNVHIDAEGGYLYAGTPDGVMRWPYQGNNVPGVPDTDAGADAGGNGEPVMVGQPSTGNHTFHTVHIYSGWMYVQSGSAGNVSDPATPEYDTDRSVMKRFWLADFSEGAPFIWQEGEVFAVGLRNTVGFTRHANGQLYGVVNGIDDLLYNGLDVHAMNPGDMIVRLQHGGQYGYPYCFSALHIQVGAIMVPAGTQLRTEVEGFLNPHTNMWCAENSHKPTTLVPAHSAPLDIAFLNEPTASLPDEWVGGAFVSLHGSWNTDPPVGHQVIWVPFDENGEAPMPIARVSGPDFAHQVVLSAKADGQAVAGPWSWEAGGTGEDLVRPVGVAISPVDGSLYVSSDNAPVLGTEDDSPVEGAIYRVGLER